MVFSCALVLLPDADFTSTLGAFYEEDQDSFYNAYAKSKLLAVSCASASGLCFSKTWCAFSHLDLVPPRLVLCSLLSRLHLMGVEGAG